MSDGKNKQPGGPKAPEGFADLVGEATGGTLPPDPELEKALQEAADAIPDRRRPAAAAPSELAPSEPEDRSIELALEDAAEPGSGSEEGARLRAEVAEANDRLIRLQADFENFRKRAARERLESHQYGGQNLIKDLVSVVDNLDRAVDHAQQSVGGDLQSLLQGVELVQREFLGVLNNHHIQEINADGQPFDPNLHEAMAQAPSASVPPNTIVSVFQKGYQLHDRLIRPARVVVAKAPDPGEGEE